MWASRLVGLCSTNGSSNKKSEKNPKKDSKNFAGYKKSTTFASSNKKDNKSVS